MNSNLFKKFTIFAALIGLTAAFQNCAKDFNESDYIDSASQSEGPAVTPPAPAPAAPSPMPPGPVVPPTPPSVVAPVIVSKTPDSTVSLLTPITLMVTATGEGLTYQWFKNDMPIAGATTSQIVFNSAVESDAAAYRLDVTSASGGVAVARIALAVIRLADQYPPVILTAPTNITVRIARGLFPSATQFTVVASNALTYQWHYKATSSTVFTPIAGATASVYKITPAQLGTYKVVVTNIYGSVEAEATMLTTN